MILKQCANEIEMARKKGRRCNQPPASDLCDHASNMQEVISLICTIQTFTVVIRSESNSKDMGLAPKQLHASYSDVRHWEELIEFIDNNGGLKEPYIIIVMLKCTMEQADLEEEYMGLYTNGQMIRDPTYGQILYVCCLSNASKLQLGQNPKRFLIEILTATRKESTKHIIRPTKVIPACRIQARCVLLLIITHQLRVVTMPSVAETITIVINAMRQGTYLSLANLLHTENVKHTGDHLNTSIDER